MTVFSSFLFLVPGTGRDRNFIYFGAVGFGIVFYVFVPPLLFASIFSRIKAFLLSLGYSETSIPSSSIVLSKGFSFGGEFKSHSRFLVFLVF